MKNRSNRDRNPRRRDIRDNDPQMNRQKIVERGQKGTPESYPGRGQSMPSGKNWSK